MRLNRDKVPREVLNTASSSAAVKQTFPFRILLGIYFLDLAEDFLMGATHSLPQFPRPAYNPNGQNESQVCRFG